MNNVAAASRNDLLLMTLSEDKVKLPNLTPMFIQTPDKGTGVPYKQFHFFDKLNVAVFLILNSKKPL